MAQDPIEWRQFVSALGAFGSDEDEFAILVNQHRTGDLSNYGLKSSMCNEGDLSTYGLKSSMCNEADLQTNNNKLAIAF
jgi:hypothetical protein